MMLSTIMLNLYFQFQLRVDAMITFLFIFTVVMIQRRQRPTPLYSSATTDVYNGHVRRITPQLSSDALWCGV